MHEKRTKSKLKSVYMLEKKIDNSEMTWIVIEICEAHNVFNVILLLVLSFKGPMRIVGR